MNNKKKIIVILVILLIVAIGGSLSVLLLDLGKFKGLVMRLSVVAFLATIVFLAGLAKGRRR